jgi:hypothetical protein
MAPFKKVGFALATAGLLSSGMAQAALNDRGGGLLYDDVLNVTWLQDANYAKTSGYTGVQDIDGGMTWTVAKTWADNLVYGGYSDWRLAANTPVGADWSYGYSPDGTTDRGYNITSTHSELSYMYYVNLGLKGYYNTSGADQPDWGVFGNGTWGGQKDFALVKNLRSLDYWSGTASTPDRAWYFKTVDGFQGDVYQGVRMHAWAVRDGDVAVTPVPEPETYAMMLVGLGLIGGIARRRKQKLSA